jgi:hypothetical protein
MENTNLDNLRGKPFLVRFQRPYHSKIPFILTGFAVVSGFLLLAAVACHPTSLAVSEVLATPGQLEYAPAIFGSPLEITPTPEPTPIPTLGPPLPPPTLVVAMPPIDFEAARATAQAQGLEIAFVKIGFHRGPAGNANGFGDYLRKLNDAGVPFFVKSAAAEGPIYEAQLIMKENEAAGRFVDHTLVYREVGTEFEAPFYNLSLSPEEAAEVSWQINRDAVAPELDKNYFWLETLNEPGRYGDDGQLQIERLGRFSLATAKLAVAEGYKYAAFSFSFGLPEKEDWEDPAMLDFLRYAGEHPNQVAVALHEYSGTISSIQVPLPISEGYPYRVGRFQELFDVCDQYGIPRPTVLITEWGWEYNRVPDVNQAMLDINWASWLYAAYPQVKGASIWYLGGGSQFGDIANQTQRLIAPMADYAVSHYYIIDPGIGQIDPSIFLPPGMSRILPEDRSAKATPAPRQSILP